MLFVAGLLALGVGVAGLPADGRRPAGPAAGRRRHRAPPRHHRPPPAGRRRGVHRLRGRRGRRQVDAGAPAAGVADQRGPRRAGHLRARRDAVRRRRSGRSCSTGRTPASPRAPRRCCTPPTAPSTCTTCCARRWTPARWSSPTGSSTARWPTRAPAARSRWTTSGCSPAGRPRGCSPTSPCCSTSRPRWAWRAPAGRAVADRLESESLEFHQRVRQTFRALAEADPDRYLVVDARQTPDEIAAVIRVRVAELLSGLPLQQIAPPVPGRARGDRAPRSPAARTIRTPRRARPPSCTRDGAGPRASGRRSSARPPSSPNCARRSRIPRR